MRYTIVTLILTVLTSTLALAASTDQLAATKHNFTTGTYELGTNNICQPCHTPHHAITEDAISTRLWNHALSTATYTLYDGTSAAFTTHVDGSQGMDRVSRLCLGCHDGTVALDAFGMGTTGVAAGNPGSLFLSATDTRNLGTNFTNDHPVGLEALVLNNDGTPAKTPYRLKLPVVSGTRASISGLSLAKTADGFVVGCRTCHSPHGAAAQDGVSFNPIGKLLNVTEDKICTSCHYK